MSTHLNPAPPLLFLLICAGCAAQGEYPSLATRPIETQRFEVAAPEPAAVVEAAPDADIGAQVAAAERSRDAFAAERSSAQAIVAAARGGVSGGEAWVTAQQALTRLERTMAPAASALAALDERMIQASSTPPGPSAQLNDAWQAVSAIVADQRAAMDALSVSLPSP